MRPGRTEAGWRINRTSIIKLQSLKLKKKNGLDRIECKIDKCEEKTSGLEDGSEGTALNKQNW